MEQFILQVHLLFSSWRTVDTAPLNDCVSVQDSVCMPV